MAGNILIVEDDEPVRTVFARALRREGHHVDEVADGEAALEVIATRRYQVILLDLRLPKKSGFEVLQSMRADPIIPPPFILVLSSAPEDIHRVAGHPRVMLSINKTFALQHLDPVVAAICAVVELPVLSA